MPLINPEDLAASKDRTQTRWRSIRKPTLYLDFRSELSAYDKFMHHGPSKEGRTTPAERKRWIRRRSARVSAAIAGHPGSRSYHGVDRVVGSVRELGPDRLENVSQILGRNYVEICLVRHTFFDVEGSTVVLRTDNLKYSEAFAGSGEFAVVQLVDRVHSAEDGTLVLIDEPEVSLHPEAQRELMGFLRRMTVKKKLQIVLSTHSPSIVGGLPDDAIKSLQHDQATGTVSLVSQRCTPEVAFVRLGADFTAAAVYVEDDLAAEIVKTALQIDGEEHLRLVDIRALGGAGSIRKYNLPSFAKGGLHALVLLDGDQRPAGQEPATTASAVDRLSWLLGAKVKPYGADEESAGQILAWAADHLDYLPGSTPEGLLAKMRPTLNLPSTKEGWTTHARNELGLLPGEPDPVSGQIFMTQQRALAKIRRLDSPELDEIRARVKRYLEEERRHGGQTTGR